MAELSICIPAYTRQWLPETLASIEPIRVNIGTAWEGVIEHEVVVVDDTEGRGAGWARNRAFEQASGEWILKVDADDLLTDGLLMQLFMARDVYSIICPEAAQFFDEDGLRHRWSYAGITAGEVVSRIASPASSAGCLLYHRTLHSLYGGFPEDCGAYESWVFVCKRVAAGHPIVTVPGTHYLHRLHPDSYWGRRNEGRQDDMQRAMLAVNEVYAEAFS